MEILPHETPPVKGAGPDGVQAGGSSNGQYDPVAVVVAALERHGFEPQPNGTDEWKSKCPGHQGDGFKEGDGLKLEIKRGNNGSALLCCQAHRCNIKAILSPLKMEEKELFLPDQSRNGHAKATRATAKPPVGRADPDTLNKVYRALLGRLGLSDADKTWLADRGFDAKEAERRGYRTMPERDRESIAWTLAKEFGKDALLGVPGFFVNGRGSPSIASVAGLVIPVLDSGHRVNGLKIRPHRKLADGGKYLWISSARHGGPSPGSPIHVPLRTPIPVGTVRITEGPLKGDAATILSGMPTIGLPGVGHQDGIVDLLRRLGATTVRIAFDVDWRDNAEVRKALHRLARTLLKEGFAAEIEDWDPAHKGIDDLLLAGKSTRILAGQEGLDLIGLAIPETQGEGPTPAAPAPAQPAVDIEAIRAKVSAALSGKFSGVLRDKPLLADLAALAQVDPVEFAAVRADLAEMRHFRSGDLDDALAKVARAAASPGPDRPAAVIDDHPNALPFGVAEDDPHRLARLFLADHQHADGCRFVFHRGDPRRWDGACYRPYPGLDADLIRCIKQEFDRHYGFKLMQHGMKSGGEGKDAPQLRKVTRSTVADTIPALESLASIPADRDLPCWRDPRPDDPDPTDIIAVRNGLLFIGGPQPRLIPHTPRYLGTCCLPFDYIPDAPEPSLWLKMLRRQWPKDQESIDSLHEFFGYCCTPRTNRHKILILHGPTRCGKGTTREVLTALVGTANTASTSAIGLSGPFGLQPLLGKLVAFMGDARIGDSHDSAVMMDRILRLSGGDPLDINVKGKPALEQVSLPTKLVIFTNEVPNLRDSSGAITRRYLILSMTQEIPEEEQDVDLSARIIKSELPSILNLALAGLKRLREQGRFVQPRSARHLIEMAQDMASPVKVFFEHMQEEKGWDYQPGYSVPVDVAFSAWNQWAHFNNYSPGNVATFGKNLHAAFPKVKRTRPRDPETGKQVPHYDGIGFPPPPDDDWSRTGQP